MLFANEEERRFARAVAALVYGNPFLPERIEAERAALGAACDPAATLWEVREEHPFQDPGRDRRTLNDQLAGVEVRRRTTTHPGARLCSNSPAF